MTNAEIEKDPYIEFDWIGQGYGYKSNKDWRDMAMDEVIYVPEYAIIKDNNGKEFAETWFTKEDFIDLCSDEKCPVNAETLFDMVDWQFPETLLDEIWEEN